jgi:hypothetical protein
MHQILTMATKTVYLVDTAGLLIGTTQADESPMQPGRWLLPAGAIETPPPATVPASGCPRWNGSGWVIVAAARPRTAAL